jgi:hypothetical protein
MLPPNFGSIFVRPGIYSENIKFLGKSVFLVSEKGTDVTIIDGGGLDSVLAYTGAERGVLAGFTIRNGRSGFDTPGFGSGGVSELLMAPNRPLSKMSLPEIKLAAGAVYHPIFHHRLLLKI